MTALPAPLDPPQRVLLGPGPSDPHPRVLEALARGTLGHLDPAYLEIMSQLQGMLRTVFRTTNPMTMAISGTGSAGMEASVLNVIEPGDSMVVCAAGVFGSRLIEVAERAGAKVTRVERPWGTIFTTDDLKEALKAKPKVVGVIMAETSTGVLQPIEEISKMVHDAGAILLVDAVTSLGGVPVEVDKWNIDVIFSGSQKCLGCPPGLAPISFSPRAMKVIAERKTKPQSWYFDISALSKYWDADRVYHHTAPINMTYALHEGLRLLLTEGLEASFARHQLNYRALRAGLTSLGLEYVAQKGHELPQLNAVRIPAGVDDLTIRKALLTRFGIEIGAGLGAFKGQVWRIGLMGYSSRANNVLLVLAALDQLLAEAGLKFPRGGAVAAANDVYTAASGGVKPPA